MNFKMADTRVSDECVKTIKSQIEEMAFHLNVKTGRKRKKNWRDFIPGDETRA